MDHVTLNENLLNSAVFVECNAWCRIAVNQFVFDNLRGFRELGHFVDSPEIGLIIAGHQIDANSGHGREFHWQE